MSSSITSLHVLFRGIITDFEEDDDDDEIDLGYLDSKAHELQDELNRIQPYRFPSLQMDYLGITGDIELIFKFRITWMDRQADIDDYLDEVEVIVENGMNALLNEREILGTSVH